jgi:hypothetical protein
MASESGQPWVRQLQLRQLAPIIHGVALGRVLSGCWSVFEASPGEPGVDVARRHVGDRYGAVSCHGSRVWLAVISV